MNTLMYFHDLSSINLKRNFLIKKKSGICILRNIITKYVLICLNAVVCILLIKKKMYTSNLGLICLG